MLKKIAWILLIIGGLNWLLVAINPAWEVGALIGHAATAKVIYVLVGLSALVAIFGGGCGSCKSDSAPGANM